MLHSNEPWQHHGKIENHARPPKRAAQNVPFAAQKSKGGDDENGEKRRNRPLGQRRQSRKKVNVVEPEFGVGFVPRVPAQQPDGQRRRHLHIGGSPTRKGHDACTSNRNERCVKMPARPESLHVQVDEADHDESESRRGQSRGPVVHTEVLEDEHCAPVIERGLLKPRASVEIWGDAGGQTILQRVGGVKAHQHLVRDLRIARLVGSHQPQAVSAQCRRNSIDKEENAEGQKNQRFADGGPARHMPTHSCLQVPPRRFYRIVHPRQFSKKRVSLLCAGRKSRFYAGRMETAAGLLAFHTKKRVKIPKRLFFTFVQTTGK